MNPAFAAHTAAMFQGPLSCEALWQQGGEGPTLPLRVMVKAPDTVQDFAATRIWTNTMVALVQTADIQAPQSGDYVSIDGDWYVVDGEPQRDAHRLTWRVTLVPEARA